MPIEERAFVLTGADDPDIAFAPNGNIMARDGDDVYDSYSDWEWADEFLLRIGLAYI